MESELESYLRVLHKRLRNLKKKAEKFEQKKKEASIGAKSLKPTEAKALDNLSQIENSIQEVERAIKSMSEVTSTSTKAPEPEKPVEQDSSPDVVNLWAVCEFLTHQDTHCSLDPEEKDMAEGLASIARVVAGQPGTKFEENLFATYTHIESYLLKSQGYLSDSRNTYFSLNEFVHTVLRTFGNQIRPETPTNKPELTFEIGPAWEGNTEWTEPAKDQVWGEATYEEPAKEEVKVEESIKEEVIAQPVETVEVNLPEEESKDVEAVKETKKPLNPEDDFIEVTGRKKERGEKSEKGRGEKSERGRGNNRGQRSGGQRYRRKA